MTSSQITPDASGTERALIERSPLIRFVEREAAGTLASVMVYACARVGEALFDFLDRFISVTQPGPSAFLHAVFTWGGAFAATSVWLIVTWHEIMEFRYRMKHRDIKARASLDPGRR